MSQELAPIDPTISVALCTYNGASYVREQLMSILSQSRPVDEIIVSDDASIDGTLDVVAEVRALERGPEIRVLRNDAALGVTANFEQAIRATNGDIVILSDQDDVWHPDRVANAVRALAGHPLLHFSDARLVDANGKPQEGSLFSTLELTPATLVALTDGRAFETLVRRNIATGATVSFKRDLLEDALPFPVNWVHDEWLTVLAAAHERVETSAEKLIDYRLHGSNQIGVVPPTLRRKIARVLQPRGNRNKDLAERSKLLLTRLEALGADHKVVALARNKADIEQFRADLPSARIRRVIPVLRRAPSGDYQRYCSQGAMDIVRDLLQPA